MTQDEIIDIAVQAGMAKEIAEVNIDIVEAFAKLVAEAEREACAKLVEGLPAPDVYSDTDQSMWDVTCIGCADAIRARGQA